MYLYTQWLYSLLPLLEATGYPIGFIFSLEGTTGQMHSGSPMACTPEESWLVATVAVPHPTQFREQVFSSFF